MESANVIIEDFKDFAKFFIKEKDSKFIENEEKSNSSDNTTNGRTLIEKVFNQSNSKDQSQVIDFTNDNFSQSSQENKRNKI